MNTDATRTRELNPIADAVREFYNGHPYPPPVTNLDRQRQIGQDVNRSRADFHLLWPAAEYRQDLDVLIAGCGTFQAAKYALSRPAAHVTGIDVSSTSLDHTEKLKRQYNLTNLDLQQLPVENVHELQRRFDLIVCTGVLHHLADPDAGLRALGSVLKPDGAIHLMVYAPYGRAGVYMLQDYCRRLGVGTSDSEIRDLVAVLEALPRHHPLASLLGESPDFERANALADALLNPRDRAYSVPQLFDFIKNAELAFERWYRQAPYLPQCGALATTPHTARLAELPPPAQYAAVELWRGTMTRHSVVVRRTDARAERASVNFDGEQWSDYVPLRLPQTLCVQDRLPAGAAGVLLNRSHTNSDLILPIDAHDKLLFDAIDEHLTIAEIAEHAPTREGRDLRRARAFFERLWWYDQVVFDLSKSADHMRADERRSETSATAVQGGAS